MKYDDLTPEAQKRAYAMTAMWCLAYCQPEYIDHGFVGSYYKGCDASEDDLFHHIFALGSLLTDREISLDDTWINDALGECEFDEHGFLVEIHTFFTDGTVDNLWGLRDRVKKC